LKTTTATETDSFRIEKNTKTKGILPFLSKLRSNTHFCFLTSILNENLTTFDDLNSFIYRSSYFFLGSLTFPTPTNLVRRDLCMAHSKATLVGGNNKPRPITKANLETHLH
jgi:hypothetical protein